MSAILVQASSDGSIGGSINARGFQNVPGGNFLPSWGSERVGSQHSVLQVEDAKCVSVLVARLPTVIYPVDSLAEEERQVRSGSAT